MGLRIHRWCGNFLRQESGTTSRASISSFVRHALSGWHASFKPSKVAQRRNVSHPLGDLGSFWGKKSTPLPSHGKWRHRRPKNTQAVCWNAHFLARAVCERCGNFKLFHILFYIQCYSKKYVKYSIFLMLKVQSSYGHTSKLKVLIFASEKWLPKADSMSWHVWNANRLRSFGPMLH